MHRRGFLRGIGTSIALVSGGIVSTGPTWAHPGPYEPLGSVAIENAREAVPGPNGDVAYVAATDGFATVDVSVPSDPRILAEKRDLLADRETGPLRQIQDVKVEGDRLVVVGPANPLRGDVLQGVLLYDVSDPANPKQVAFHETEFPIHNCSLSGGVVYLTGRGDGTSPLVAVDVSDDEPAEVGRWSLVDRDERWADVVPALRMLHDAWVQDGRAYLSYWDAGTYLLDVDDPASPSFVARIGGRPLEELLAVPRESVRAQVLRLPGNDHAARANEDGSLLAINKEAWVVEGRGKPGGVELWDVSDPGDARRLATIDAPQTSDPSIDGTWTTSHNLDFTDGRLFTSWYQGGVKIHDVSDPENPEELAWWRDPGETSFWTAERATPEFFVASSMGRRANGKGALYTFPNHAGQQKDPPSLTESASDGPDNGSSTASATTKEATTTEQALAGESGTGDDSASSDVPGLGVPAAVAALLGTGTWRMLRE